MVVVAALLGVFGAGVANAVLPVTYQAHARQFVSFADAGESSSNVLNGSQFTLQRVKSYTEVATSSEVLTPVLRRLQLPMTLDRLTSEVSATNPLDTVLIDITVTDTSPQRAADIANAVATQLQASVQTLEEPADGGVSPVKVSLIEEAVPPSVPVSPRITLNYALGLLVGLALGIGAALLREQLNTTVKTIEDVETVTGGVPLGLVPFDPQAKSQPLVTSNPQGLRAEAFRKLRTNLQFADVDHPPRAIVITSPLPNEGKTSSACNMALTLAQNGKRVALLEADLRKPRLATYLDLDNAVGLTNVLAGQVPLDDALVPYGDTGVTVLAAGRIPPNPSEMLGSQHMARVLAQLRERYDAVVIDAPPLLPVTDAAVLSTLADGALMVVRHGSTDRSEVARALQALAAVNGRLIGTVLNFLPRQRRLLGGRAYGYGYVYAYQDGAAVAGADPGRGASGGTGTPAVVDLAAPVPVTTGPGAKGPGAKGKGGAGQGSPRDPERAAG